MEDKFILTMNKDWFHKGSILEVPSGNYVIVLKTYRKTLLRKFLRFIGFNIRMNNKYECYYKCKIVS